MKKTKFLLIVLCLLTGRIAAQINTAQIYGVVRDSKGSTVATSTVSAVHQPTGIVYYSNVSSTGTYQFPALRVGGPYKVTVVTPGYHQDSASDIFLDAGQIMPLDFTIYLSSELLSTIKIAVDRNKILNSQNTGAGTVVDKDQINTLPTINRSLTDFMRLMPQSKNSSVASTAGQGTSFAGQDSRFNNLTIDGSIFNNSFGLASGPGGQTNAAPISLEAVQQIAVSLAPYDVRQGGFTGAGVNAITRSGSNKIEGSVFYNFRNQSMVGKKADGVDLTITDFAVKQYGFRIGGPIIKNKVFFFLNGESERRTDPANTYTALRPGQTPGGNISRVRASLLDSFRTILKQKFNYETGEYENYQLETESDKFLAKFDFNISPKHQLSLRGNALKSSREVLPNNSGVINSNFGRTRNQYAMSFENTNYIINNDIYSAIAELNSTLSSKLFNNFQVGYTANRDYRSSNGGVFPLVDILDGAGINLLSFGYEAFTPYNRLNTNTFQIQDNLTMYKGKHTFTLGASLESFKFINTFMPNLYGHYIFNNSNDFFNKALNGDSVSTRRYTLQYSVVTGDPTPAAITKVNQASAYVQDALQVSKRLKLTMGIRIDLPMYDETGLKNAKVDTMKFKDETGATKLYSTNKMPSINPLISPRVGFNWNAIGERELQVRGGTGVFSGRPAFVWLSNQIGNNGIISNQVRIDNTKNYPFSANVNKYVPTNLSTSNSFNLALTDEGFTFPQLWRTDLGADAKLPWWGLIGSLEAVYSKTLNNVYYINANQEASKANFAGPDNRPYFPGLGLTSTAQNNALRIYDNVTDAIVLKNTNKGFSTNITLKLEKPFKKTSFGELGGMIAYNFGMAKDIMTAGSIANSSWRDVKTLKGNNLPELTYSDFDQRNRIIANINYRISYGKKLNMATTVSLFFQSGNQGRYTFTINGDMNGDAIAGNDVMYVPKDASEIIFVPLTAGSKTYTAAEQSDALIKFIDNNDYLKANKGKYAERNGAILPWLSTIDLSLQQDLGKTFGKNKNRIQLRWDCYNFLNLINNGWGVGNQITNASVLSYVGKDVNNNPTYKMVLNSDNTLPTVAYKKSNTLGDVWQMQIGVRYIFN